MTVDRIPRNALHAKFRAKETKADQDYGNINEDVASLGLTLRTQETEESNAFDKLQRTMEVFFPVSMTAKWLASEN